MSYQPCPDCGHMFEPYEGECEECMDTFKGNFGGKLKHAARVKSPFKGADFWIIRKGSIKKVGSPTREYSPEHIGVKANDEFHPSFLFYLVQFMFNNGDFKPLASGMTDLQNIRVEDVKKMSILSGLGNLPGYKLGLGGWSK